MKKTTKGHLEESLAEIKQTDIYLVTRSSMFGNLMDTGYKQGFAGAPASKFLLSVAE